MRCIKALIQNRKFLFFVSIIGTSLRLFVLLKSTEVKQPQLIIRGLTYFSMSWVGSYCLFGSIYLLSRTFSKDIFDNDKRNIFGYLGEAWFLVDSVFSLVLFNRTKNIFCLLSMYISVINYGILWKIMLPKKDHPKSKKMCE